MLSLQNRQIILGITGGIAAYKSAELCRLLIKAGAQVKVVMTAAATEFITPLTLQALSGNRVHTELLDPAAEAAMGHIELARWADLILIAPATANCMARLVSGEADDLLSTLCLASQAKLAIAPAMNQAMWSNPQTQANLQDLRARDITILGPDSGEQACGDVGPGRMLEPTQIIEQLTDIFTTGELAGKRVTITAGPTREALDPVRYISNHSSGKMAYALAEAAVDAGAKVTLISGPVTLEPPARLTLVKVESAAQMLTACLAEPGDIFISVAAVADYRPAEVSAQKIKKSGETMELKLVRNPDILATIAALGSAEDIALGSDPWTSSFASSEPGRPFCVGFAAETENLEAYAKGKLREKNLDLIFANDATATFGADESSATAYWSNEHLELPLGSKRNLATAMIKLIADRLPDSSDK